MGQVKAFIRRKTLNTPIQNFTPKTIRYGNVSKTYYTIKMELDVYPLIQKIEHTDRPVPYRCKLSPLPIIGKMSDILFEDYEMMHMRIRKPIRIYSNSMSK